MSPSFHLSLNRLRNIPLFRNAPAAQQAEQLYLAPEFSEDVVKAVRLISTCLRLNADDKSRRLWQEESNTASLVEYDALSPLFSKRDKPRKILEIGPGLGRSAVVFGKKGVWDADAAVHLYDTDGAQTKYKQKHYDAPPKWPDVSSFCGNLQLLDTVLKYNAATNCTVFDAAKNDLKTLPGPYDLIYGFYSIGFHWSLEHYLDDLEPLMDEKTLVVCTLNKHFEPFARLSGYSTRILQAAGT
jgi:hypothetical protein